MSDRRTKLPTTNTLPSRPSTGTSREAGEKSTTAVVPLSQDKRPTTPAPRTGTTGPKQPPTPQRSASRESNVVHIEDPSDPIPPVKLEFGMDFVARQNMMKAVKLMVKKANQSKR